MQNSNYLSNEKGSGAVCSSKETLQSVELAPGERIDDLQLNGLSLIQSADAFRFGTDSVLLAHFAHVNAKEYCVDLGAGAGALSFLLHGRTGCRILGIEIDARQADRFLRSVRLNGLNEAEITAVNADYIDYSLKSKTKFDCAICNPPYHQHDCGAISQKGAATHDIAAPIKELLRNFLNMAVNFSCVFPQGGCAMLLLRFRPPGLSLNGCVLLQASRKPRLILR